MKKVTGHDWMDEPYSAIIREVAFKPGVEPKGKVYAVVGRSSSKAMFEVEVLEGGWWPEGQSIVIYADTIDEAKSSFRSFMSSSN